MLRTDESETEILLGNKQLLGIFFVVAILLGIAFYGGYMVGKAGAGKTAVATGASQQVASTSTSTGGETHTIAGDTSTRSEVNPTDATEPDTTPAAEPPLGTPKTKKTAPAAPASNSAVAPAGAQATDNFTPEPGQEFLQVTAVGRDEALGVAHVLRSEGFRAHAVPKPGNSKIYRVLVGPLRDAGDLSTTREALRRTGFREVIVQKY